MELGIGHHGKREVFCSHCLSVLCHNLDVMHIEKNMCDNIIGMLL